MYYLDTSALVKLIFDEVESAALDSFVGSADVATCALGRVELRRVALRTDPDQLSLVDELLRSCFEVSLTPALLDRAGVAQPAALRSLDAIHLSAALTLGPEVEAFVAYDDRLLAAAEQSGLTTARPT